MLLGWPLGSVIASSFIFKTIMNNEEWCLYIKYLHTQQVILNSECIYKAAFRSALTTVHSRSGGGDDLTGRHLAIRTNNQLRIMLGSEGPRFLKCFLFDINVRITISTWQIYCRDGYHIKGCRPSRGREGSLKIKAFISTSKPGWNVQLRYDNRCFRAERLQCFRSSRNNGVASRF